GSDQVRTQVLRARARAFRLGFAVRSGEGLDVHAHDDRNRRPAGCLARGAPCDLRRQCAAVAEAALNGSSVAENSQGESKMDERERHDKGMTVRRAVLGDAHVDRTQTRKNAFNTEFQELITRYAWG